MINTNKNFSKNKKELVAGKRESKFLMIKIWCLPVAVKFRFVSGRISLENERHPHSATVRSRLKRNCGLSEIKHSGLQLQCECG